MNNDIVGWFPDENSILLDKLISEHDIETVIEIGSYAGKSAIFFAQRVEKVYAIEPFTADQLGYAKVGKEYKLTTERQFQAFFNNCRFYRNIHLLQGTSLQASMEYPDLTADLIYIDGSHEYEDVVKDIKLWSHRAKKILCGDDYTPGWAGVRKAVDEMLPSANKEQRVWYQEI